MAGIKGKGGKKGRSGRKSKYQELADARDVEEMFFGPQDQEELERRIMSGKFSVRDRYILTALEGDSKVLTSLSNKALPDKVEIKEETTLKIDV